MLKNDKFAFEGNKSKVVRRTVLTYESGPHCKKVSETLDYAVPTPILSIDRSLQLPISEFTSKLTSNISLNDTHTKNAFKTILSRVKYKH
jgi:hypothetical protein